MAPASAALCLMPLAGSGLPTRGGQDAVYMGTVASLRMHWYGRGPRRWCTLTVHDDSLGMSFLQNKLHYEQVDLRNRQTHTEFPPNFTIVL
jgi:hypothetical protein